MDTACHSMQESISRDNTSWEIKSYFWGSNSSLCKICSPWWHILPLVLGATHPYCSRRKTWIAIRRQDIVTHAGEDPATGDPIYWSYHLFKGFWHLAPGEHLIQECASMQNTSWEEPLLLHKLCVPWVLWWLILHSNSFWIQSLLNCVLFSLLRSL